MKKEIQELRKKIVEASSAKSFIHHEWFMKYHLKIVYKISVELIEIYPEADKNTVEVLVWLHDYGKVIDFKNHNEALLVKGKELLKKIGFDKIFISRVMSYLKIFEKKMTLDLNNAPIEVKIVSSADAASHFFGPFHFLWLYENSNKPFKELTEDKVQKVKKDWENKMVLPEVKNLVQERYNYLLELTGNLPDKYLMS